jgi:adenine-specific DNA-methyltransferase
VWDIPNVKSKHVEKTAHPCQFPAALVTRLVRALTKKGDLVMDPFLGSGTSCVSALIEQRNFVGCETEPRYVCIVRDRLRQLRSGKLHIRADVPVRTPKESEAVSVAPPHFLINTGA